jgi:F-type H+-transporting ATPase subunit delta
MNEGLVTTRYAKSLYQAAEEEGKADIIYQNISELDIALSESPEFKILLYSPVIKDSEKENIFILLFKELIDELTLNFLLLLLKNKREQFLPSICRYYRQLHKEMMGIHEGFLTTTVPLDVKNKDGIHQLIRQKFNIDVELTEKIDPSLIGGFVLRIDDQQIDASISSKLKKIKTELINS